MLSALLVWMNENILYLAFTETARSSPTSRALADTQAGICCARSSATIRSRVSSL